MYNLIVNTAYLNGRATPSSNGTLVFPAGATLSTGFKMNDILESDTYVLDSNGSTKWYKITKCTRAGVIITIPNPVYASDGASYKYLIPYVVPDPEPTPEFPTSIWVSMTADGERREYRLV